MDYRLYIYDGPVMSFGKMLCPKWKGATRAPSEKKALSNLAYRYKKKNGMTPSAKIRLVPRYLTPIYEGFDGEQLSLDLSQYL